MTTAIILAAGRGTRLLPHTSEIPKCLITIQGLPILHHQLASIEKKKIYHVILVIGYMAEKVINYARIHFPKIIFTFVTNPLFASTNTLYSLALASEIADINGPVMLINGDVIFDPELLNRMLNENITTSRAAVEFKNCGDEEIKCRLSEDGSIQALNKRISEHQTAGEAIGINFFAGDFWLILKSELAALKLKNPNEYFEYAVETTIARGAKIYPLNIAPYRVIEIDFPHDLRRAEAVFEYYHPSHSLRVIESVIQTWETALSGDWTSGEKSALAEILKTKKEFITHHSSEKINIKIFGETGRYSRTREEERPIKHGHESFSNVIKKISIPHVFGAFLYGITVRLDIKKILELGTGYGISALYFLNAMRQRGDGRLISVEHKTKYAPYHTFLLGEPKNGIFNIVYGDTHRLLPDLFKNHGPFHLVFHDASHIGKKVMNETELILKSLPPLGILIIDDIYWSDEMAMMWRHISKKREVAYALPLIHKNKTRMGVLIKT